MCIGKIRAYFERDKSLLNIFLVYFFLTFIIGYLDYDRRVLSFEQSTRYLEQVVKGEFEPPMVRRVLVPYTVYFFSRFLHLPLYYTFAAFRFLFFFLAFVLFHIYLKKWFDNKTAMIGTLSLIASLPITFTNWYCVPTDMPELISFILAMIWIKDNKHKHLFVLIPLASLNRETAVALVMLYFFYNIGREKWHILIRRTAVYTLLWLIPSVLLIWKFGLRDMSSFFCTLGPNLRRLADIFRAPGPYNYTQFLFYLCGFYWILAFRDFRKKDPLLKRSVIVMVIYFIYAFMRVGALSEVRTFIPFYVFVIPLGLFSLFKEQEPL